MCAVLLAPVVEANVRALRERDSPGLRRYTEATGLLIGRDDATSRTRWIGCADGRRA